MYLAGLFCFCFFVKEHVCYFLFVFSFLCPKQFSTVVLKSTCAAGAGFNPAPIVINEQRVVGSRCGPFEVALELLASSDDAVDVEQYISGTEVL